LVRRSDLGLALTMAIFFIVFMVKGAYVAPPSFPATPAPGDFDTDRAFARLQRILGDERPHPVDSAANDAVRERLIDEIQKIGFEPALRDDFSCRAMARWSLLSCARVRNVVFRAGPSDGEATLIAAHYDSVAAGPGAADDGAGLAALLEIAALLKARAPSKPVIFLVTDGEEAGLLGAASFIRKDPLAKTISNVINMEARGVSGPAILFQTSEPNGRDITAFARYAKSPVGNSLAADIYKMLPNDTDLTEFLKLPADEVNFAFSDHVSFYHTPRDNLENLSKDSLHHMGVSALAALDGFMTADVDARKKPEGDFVYADAFDKFIVVMPALLAFILNLAAFVTATFGFVREKDAGAMRALLAAPAAILVGGVIGAALISLLAAIRPENIFWGAEPAATRAVIYGAAIAGGAAAMALAAETGQRRLIYAVWIWFSLIGLALFAITQGSGGLTGLPSGLFLCAMIASFGAKRLLAPLSIIAVIGALLFWAPALAMAETGLGLGKAGAFAAPAALLFMLAAPVFSSREKPGALLLAAPFAVAVIAFVAALGVKAYSHAEPRALSLTRIEDAQTNLAWFSLGAPGEKAPAPMAALADFKPAEISGLEGVRLVAPAPPLAEPAVGVKSSNADPEGEARRSTISFAANGADKIIALIPGDAGLGRITVGGEAFEFAGDKDTTLVCTGRECADFTFTAALGPALSEWKILGVRYGLAASGAAIARARPDWAVPIQDGDRRLVVTSAEL